MAPSYSWACRGLWACSGLAVGCCADWTLVGARICRVVGGAGLHDFGGLDEYLFRFCARARSVCGRGWMADCWTLVRDGGNFGGPGSGRKFGRGSFCGLEFGFGAADWAAQAAPSAGTGF